MRIIAGPCQHETLAQSAEIAKECKRHALVAYPSLKVTQEETVESLEQLRWLKNGWQIGAQSVYFNGVEINTPEDVETWQQKNLR